MTPSTTKILGIDAASVLGWAVQEPGHIQGGEVRFTPPKKGRKTLPDSHPGERMTECHIHVRNLIKEHKPTHMAYELPGGGQGRYSMLLLSAYRGICLNLANFYRLPFMEIAPNSLKKWAVGRGDAKKPVMEKELLEQLASRDLHYKGCLNDLTDNIVDAIWLTEWAYWRIEKGDYNEKQ